MPMDSFKPQNVKPRKTKMIAKKSGVQILSSLFFRAIEIIVVVVSVAKLIFQLVITFENSGERFKGLTVLLVNRHLMFIIGNAIIIVLLAKSCQYRNQESDTQSTSNDFYEEFVRENAREERDSRAEMKNEGKQSIGENLGKQSTTETLGKQNTSEHKEKQRKSYGRSRSENFEGSKSCYGKLNRSGTEIFVDKFSSDEKIRHQDDGMSNDELRYKIESFIARQRRCQMDEEFCIT